MQKPPTVFHAHFFFDAHEQEAADAMRVELVHSIPKAEVGRFLPRAAGPLPSPMFMVTFGDRLLPRVVEFIEKYRKHRSVLVHPVSNDELADHTAGARWFGAPLHLRLDRL